jgi:methylmalonyl-CoA mutase cobalamin-binding subunit
MIATTPAGQLHEMGAILVAAAGTAEGWRVTFTGAALPAEEIVQVAISHHAQVVALSLVHPDDDPTLPPELRRLRRLLPKEITIIAGGRAAEFYQTTLLEIGALTIKSLDDLRGFLASPQCRQVPKAAVSEIAMAPGKLRLR